MLWAHPLVRKGSRMWGRRRWRAGRLLVALVVGLGVIVVGTPAAQATTYPSTYSELSLPGQADNNYQVVLSGRVIPVAGSRPVSLYSGVAPDGSGGAWIAGTWTDANGRFSFVTTVTTATRFKFFAAKQVVGRDTYTAASTGAFVVSPPTPVTYPSNWSELSLPEYTNSGDQQVSISGRIWPALSGRPVSLYSGVAPDGSGGTWIAGANTDANGRFSFVTSVSVVTRFKLFSAKQQFGATTYDAASTGAFTIKSLRFWDTFDGYNDSVDQMLQSGRWTIRQPAYQVFDPSRPPEKQRSRSKGDKRAVELGGSQLKLKVMRDPDDTSKYLTGHLTAGNLGFAYGHVEARIKFQRPHGASGALWWQSGYDTSAGQAEFDIAEYFGDASPLNIKHTVYYGTDQYFSTTPAPDAAPSTWWDSFHTFEGYWDRDGYRFKVDDRPIRFLDTAGHVGSVPAEVILSLLVNDKQATTLDTDYPTAASLANHVITVDWIRVWR